MYEKVYNAISLMVEDVGILGIAIIGLILWACISTLCEKRKRTEPQPPKVDHIQEFLDERKS